MCDAPKLLLPCCISPAHDHQGAFAQFPAPAVRQAFLEPLSGVHRVLERLTLIIPILQMEDLLPFTQQGASQICTCACLSGCLACHSHNTLFILTAWAPEDAPESSKSPGVNSITTRLDLKFTATGFLATAWTRA